MGFPIIKRRRKVGGDYTVLVRFGPQESAALHNSFKDHELTPFARDACCCRLPKSNAARQLHRFCFVRYNIWAWKFVKTRVRRDRQEQKYVRQTARHTQFHSRVGFSNACNHESHQI
jgi:hypothetical protein